MTRSQVQVMDQVQQLGKYRLIRHIATGGMAEIWLAEHEGPGGFNRQTAIKRILPHMARDTKFVEMFLDEARLVANLTHPNIGQIYDIGDVDGQYFIAMEYIEGLDLSDLLEHTQQRGEFLPLGVALYIAAQLLMALEFAHNYTGRDGQHVGLIHRDVTPHNVLLSNEGAVKLLDFGVAKARDNQTKTQTGAVKGKFAYMAPEQIESAKDIDRRADVFATGIVLYELLTGAKPFGDDLFAVNAILTRDPEDPRKHRPDLPQTIVNILMVALAKDRAQRYQSAQTMQQDLEEFMQASGIFVSPRDAAVYVRDLQGLAPPATSRIELGAGPRARITERERNVPFATGDNPMSTPRPPLSGTASAIMTPGPMAATSGAADDPRHEPSATTRAHPARAEQRGLMAIAVVVILGIVVAGSVALLIIVGLGDKPQPKPQPAPGAVVSAPPTTTPAPLKPPVVVTPPQPQPQPAPVGNPKLLRTPQGMVVEINAKSPDALLYMQGLLVSKLPFTTTLRPGTYQVEVRQGSKREPLTLKVNDKVPFQKFSSKL